MTEQQQEAFDDKSAILLDWDAYYMRFRAEHGDPVLCNGRLLFPDGWMYSARDTMGPEWAPPAEAVKLLQLQYDYWKLRRAVVAEELAAMKHMLASLRELQFAKSVPLQHIRKVDDKVVREDLVLTAEELRVQWLEEDLKTCDEMLKELVA